MGSLATSLKLSLLAAGTATLFVVFFGILFAYILAFKNFRGKGILDIVLTLPMVLPPTVTGYYLIVLLGRNGIVGKPLYDLTGLSIMFSWPAAAVASFCVALPLMIRTTRAAMESVDRNLIDASWTLGHSRLETLRRVIIPLSKRGIIAGTVLAFTRALGEFGATLMLAGNIPGKTDTMPLRIYSLTASGDWERANLIVLLLTVVSAVFLLLSGKLGEKR